MPYRQTFSCIDAHTCGNPVRLVRSGTPPLVGATMDEKRQHFLREFDWIRKGLMFEPRGHDMMSGSFLYPPRIRKMIWPLSLLKPAAVCRCADMVQSAPSPLPLNMD